MVTCLYLSIAGILKKYDLLTTHADRIAGHFTIMRRQSKYTSECLRVKGWKEMLMSDKNYGLDEAYLTRKVLSLSQRICRKLFYLTLNHFISPDSSQYWSDLIGKYIQFTNPQVRMREYYTTFKPKKDTIITYNPITSEIKVPIDQDSKIVTGGVDCIFTSFSLKRPNIGRLTNTGKMDFIKYPKDMILVKAA